MEISLEAPKVNINEDLKKRIPPLLDEEFSQLEVNCLASGIRDKLIIANYPDQETGEMLKVLADGHNRYEIAKKHNLKFETTTINFESFIDVKLWMIRNQKGRRNLSDFSRYELEQEEAELLREKGRAKQGTRTDLLSTIDKKLPKHNTQKEIAQNLGWSTGKVAMSDVVAKKVDDETRDALRQNKLSINQAYKALKQAEKNRVLAEELAKRAEQLQKDAKYEAKLFFEPASSFLDRFETQSVDLLLTDPPYFTEFDSESDFNDFTKHWLLTAISKVKPTGRAFICSGAYPVEMSVYLSYFTDLPRDWICDAPLIWTYRNTLGQTPKMKYNLNYQLIWHLYTPKSIPLNTGVTNEMFSVQDINAPDGRQGDRHHTWQKPEALARRLITHASKENDILIDPFACTGTFPLVGVALNRDAYGSDISESNLSIAKKRGCNVKF